ncbi:MAG: GAF domain-containing sensor histidine kinase, partial [Anaerolineae bacterium]
LNQIAAALNQDFDLDQALRTTLAQVAEFFNLHTGWAFLLHEENSQAYLAAAQNLPPALAEDSCRLMEGGCTCLDAYRHGGLDNRERVNVITCSRLEDLVAGTDGLRYHASIPLYAHQKPLGVLNVASAEAHWWELSEADLRLLHIVGDLLSIAIERARLFARSTQLGVIEERNRLAREIHDTLAQGLTAVALKLETADALLEAGVSPERVRQTVQQALDLTRSNLEEARRSVLDLRAAPLEGRTLVEALTALTEDWTRQHGLPAFFSAAGGTRPLAVRLEVGLYRIAQEALTNIARHAQASQVSLELVTTPTQIRLNIEDDGQGFEADDISPGRYGLLGLNERAKLLGGTLRLESSSGAGTRLEVTIPLG